MTIPKSLRPVMKIAGYTFIDDVRQRSFIVMFGFLILIVLLSRGCYQSNYMINGRPVSPETVVGTVSQVIFHVIAVGIMLITALLSMRLLRRDRDDGMQALILSKPIARWQYIVGKVVGVWFLSAIFMFTLHFIVFLIASVALGVIVPGYLVASLVASLNVLFTVIIVLLLTLFMPDIVAVLLAIGIGIVSLISDGLYALGQSQLTQSMLQQPGVEPSSGVTFWQVIYYGWPKLWGAERFASQFINGAFSPHLLYPFVNVFLYCLILGLLLLVRFGRQEIT